MSVATDPVSARYAHMFRPAVREGVALIVGLAGASGTGKTMSALRMAQGMVGRDKAFAVIDTEARRALHYAPRPGTEPDFVKTFRFDHCDLVAPFRPDAYYQAIKAAAAAGYGAVVVDSFSHVWESEGGVLDWADEILDESVERALKREERKPEGRRRAEWEIREALKRSSWIKPKRAHKVMVQALLQLRANIVLCLRAEDKIDFVKDDQGKTKAVPMEHIAGYKGWIPICDKRLPFELTASFVLTPDKPGIPQPIKLQEQHRHAFPAAELISEESGRLLAEWARGGATSAPSPSAAVHAPASSGPTTDERRDILNDLKRALEKYGYGGASDADVAKRQALLQQLFGTNSWKAIETLPLDKLRAGVKTLREENEAVA